jgi:hypothetical protein
MADAPTTADPPIPPQGRVWARATLWLLLGGWFGSYLLFGAVIAPTAFKVLPTTEIAGSFISPVLTRLHLFGAVAGLPLAWSAWRLGRSRLLVVTPIVLSAVCMLSHFGVSAELAEIRDLTFGPEGSTDAAARFGFLHRISVGVFVVVGIAVTVLIGLHARADAKVISPWGDATEH